jgi:hypothetical protein
MLRSRIWIHEFLVLLSAALPACDTAPRHITLTSQPDRPCPPAVWCLDGLVVDSRNQQPLQAPSVTVLDSDCGVVAFNGHFHLECAKPGTVWLRVGFIGYDVDSLQVQVRLGVSYTLLAKLHYNRQAPGPLIVGPDSGA